MIFNLFKKKETPVSVESIIPNEKPVLRMKTIKLVKLKDPVANSSYKDWEGRLICFVGYHKILVATPTQCHIWLDHYSISKCLNIFETEEVNIEDEWRFKPHWAKIIRVFYES
jgi:hypothetical protein